MELEKELHSSLVIFEILGLQCFSLKKLTRGNINASLSIGRIVYAIFIIFLIFCLMLLGISQAPTMLIDDQPVVTQKNVLIVAIGNALGYGMVINLIMCVVSSCISSKQVKMFFQNVREAMMLMHYEFQYAVELNKIKKSAQKRLLVLMLAFFFTYGLMIYRNFEMGLVAFMAVVPGHFYLVVNFYKFIFLVVIINQQMEDLNFLLTNHILSEETGKDREFKIIHMNQIKVTDGVLRKLKAARKIYNLIHESGALVNTSNELSILSGILLIFVILTSRGYEMFTMSIGSMSEEYFSDSACSILLAAVVFASTVLCCQKTLYLVRSVYSF